MERPGSNASITERTNSQLLQPTAQPRQYRVASRKNLPKPAQPASFTRALFWTLRQCFIARCVTSAQESVRSKATVEERSACTLSSLDMSMNHSTRAFVLPTTTEIGIQAAASTMIANEYLRAYGFLTGSVIHSWQLQAKMEQPTNVAKKRVTPVSTQVLSLWQWAKANRASAGSWSVRIRPKQSRQRRTTTAMTTVAAMRT
mmetsp:Transcript_43437/g.138248  ORF Transcript_43437/g.138248 Transcript_43437/m.138248 type:complete len:202 (-) Transcript_43437:112-717(-)